MGLDSNKTLDLHRKRIRAKAVLVKVYKSFYSRLLDSKIPKGNIIEIGSGAGFIKEFNSAITTSDVISGSGIDQVFSATNIPYQDKTIAAFLMVDTLHHIKNPEKALKEMERCLVMGGKIIMIEPYNSLWGEFIYKNFHHEHFDTSSGWDIKGKGRLSDANIAVPWIIFIRDRKIFEQKFPKLKIRKIQIHTPFSYIASGGLSKPQLIPTFLYPVFKFVENMFSPLNSLLGMFATIELEKLR